MCASGIARIPRSPIALQPCELRSSYTARRRHTGGSRRNTDAIAASRRARAARVNALSASIQLEPVISMDPMLAYDARPYIGRTERSAGDTGLRPGVEALADAAHAHARASA